MLCDGLKALRPDPRPVRSRADLHSDRGVAGVTDSQLPGPIRAPRPQRSILFQRDTVRGAPGGGLFPMIARQRPHRCIPIRLGAIAQLIAEVAAPGPETPVRSQDQSVAETKRNGGRALADWQPQRAALSRLA